MREIFVKWKLVIFLLCIVIFAFIYKLAIPDLSVSDSIYISAAMQSLTGNSIVEKYEKGKKIATIQIILSYMLIATFVYYINQ